MNNIDKWRSVFSDPDIRKSYLDYIYRWEEKIHSFLQIRPEVMESAAGAGDDNPLRGIPFSVKDNIAVDGFQLTCGSKILEGVISPYNATVINKLEAAGARVIGKNNLDQFGMGSSTENSAWGPSHNPWNPDYVTGGSSGGSAAAVAAGLVPFALGSDTGGSVRQPAAFCGVYGLKPTYGTVSRYGLVAYASSLDVIGVLSLDPGLMENVYDVMKGADPMDHSSVEPQDQPETGGNDVSVIGVLNVDSMELNDDIREGYLKSGEMLENLGYTLKEVEIPSLDYTVPAYYTIAMAEASANLARFNGIRYGLRPENPESYEDLIRQARTQGFGEEVKLRILMGTYVLRSGFQDQYYIKAQKIRTMIKNGFDSVFESVDCVLMPVFPCASFPHGEAGLTPFQQKLADNYTSSANLAGIPALSFPVTVSHGLPVGMQLAAPHFGEKRLFGVARKWHEAFPPELCPGFSQEWA